MYPMKNLILIFSFIFSLTSCVEQAAVIEEVPGDENKIAENVELNGKVLYSNHCLSCHGDLLTSDKTDALHTEISYAISDVVRMNHLDFLSTQQLIEISKVLSSSDPSRVDPQITSGSPTGAFVGATASLTIQVTTDMATSCKYDTSDVNYEQMAYDLLPNGSKLSHSKNIPLSAGAIYIFYVHCKESVYGNTTKVSQYIRFSTDLDAVDTTPPVLSITPRTEALLGGTETAQIYLNTNEFANCRFSTEINKTYSQMTNMESTGALGHVETLTNLVSGNSYTFYTLCSDPTGNISLKGTISFSIDPTLSGSLLYAQNCMGCHGGLNSSSKNGATTVEIKDAIRDVGRMRVQYLEFLSDNQIQAISDSL
jgi:mono/diheme cytochrome c family protein